MVLAPAVGRRRDEWFKELAYGLDQLEEKVDGFEVGKLVETRALSPPSFRATRTAAARRAGKHGFEESGFRLCGLPVKEQAV